MEKSMAEARRDHKDMKRVSVSIPWPLSAAETRDVLSFAFQVSLLNFLGLYLIESIHSGFVTSFYSFDMFLWFTIAAGLLSSLWPAVVPEGKKEFVKPTWRDYAWMALFALGTVAVVWYKTSTLGWLAKVIAPLSGLVVLGLSLLVYFSRDNDSETSS